MSPEAGRAHAALLALDAGCSRNEWVRLAMAAKAAGLDFDAWHDWSVSAGNYRNEADCRAVWNSLKGDGIGPGTLFQAARAAGWTDDMPRPAAAPERLRISPAPAPAARRPATDPAAFWHACAPAPADHAYLTRKGMAGDGLRVAPAGARIAGHDCTGWLALPVWNAASGELQSVQLVAPEAGPPKLSLPGCAIKGGLLVIHQDAPEGRPLPAAFADGVAYLAEGVATAASLFQTTGRAAVATFGKSNLDAVARTLCQQYPGVRLVLVPDRGAEEQAEAIVRSLGAPAAWVALPDDLPANTDANDYAASYGLDGLVELLRHERTVPPPAEWPVGDGSIAGFLATPAPARQWLFEERMPAGRAVLLAGIGGSSKTRALLHMAVGVCIGRLPWGWHVSRIGAAALVLAEDTNEDVHRSVRDVADHCGLTPAERALLADRLRIFPLAGEDTRLLRLAGAGALEPSERAQQLMEKLRGIPGLALIGIDPALAMTEGDELNPAHQRRLGELADRIAIDTGATVVLAAHAAKAMQNAEEIGSHSSRGSGAITDAVRAEYVLRTMTAAEARQHGITEIEERKAHVQLLATKGNALPPAAFAPVWLKRGPAGVLLPADLQPATGPAAPVGRRELQALEVLRSLARTSAPSFKGWREECESAGLVAGGTPDASRKAMSRIRDRLLAAGLIEAGAAAGVFVPAEDAPSA